MHDVSYQLPGTAGTTAVTHATLVTQFNARALIENLSFLLDVGP